MIEDAATSLKNFHIEPPMAEKMVRFIKADAAKGIYSKMTDDNAIARRLTEDLQIVSHDKHLRVMFNPSKTPLETAAPREPDQLPSVSRT